MRMLTSEARHRSIAALHGLWSPSDDPDTQGGGYPDTQGGQATLGTTLSAVKALALLGSRPEDPDAIDAAIAAQHDPGSGAWIDPGTGHPSVLVTASALIGLASIGAEAELLQRLPAGLTWMADHAESREEHFMTIAVAEECRAEATLPRSVAYFRSFEQPDGTFGQSALQNGIAASALLRAGQQLIDPQAVADLIMAAQTGSGGFADSGAAPQLWTTYCCMRALDLLGVAPDRARLAEWILGMGLESGGFRAEAALSGGATYQCLSILDWLASPIVNAARRGDATVVRQYLGSGGDPNLHDVVGWTPLAAAAVMGNADVVRLLLAGDEIGGTAADPDLRVPDADALPIFWAGQSGDIDTVRAILASRPEHLFATSAVNGHTVLLQATFFGTARHVDLVTWLLDHVGEILGIAADDATALREARHRLLVACNVRGYTAKTMAALWHNEALTAILSTADDTEPDERERYYADLLASIAQPAAHDPEELAAQHLIDDLVATVTMGLTELNDAAGRPGHEVMAAETALMAKVTAAMRTPGCDLNRQGGPLGQTPVIAAVTGPDADAAVTGARLRLTSLLLRHGADPDIPERHPMAVDAVIRAAVLNHVECLREMATHMRPLDFAAAVNEQPAINGQTALDDTVHRALTASDETLRRYLDQIQWVVQRGGRADIPGFTGVTAAGRAVRALTDPVMARNAPAVVAALGLDGGDPAS